MSKIILPFTLMCALLGGTAAYAQDNGGGGEFPPLCRNIDPTFRGECITDNGRTCRVGMPQTECDD